MDISFIIINYRSRDFLKPCIESIIKRVKNFSFEIIIVNNDEFPLDNFFALDKIKIIEQNKNRGFAQASNLGTKKASGRILFFLNADTEILSQNIGSIIKTFNNAAVGAVSPKLILPDGSPQPWGAGYKITALSIIKNNLGFIKDKVVWEKNEATVVDWASGAALAVKKEVFEKCGGFDEKFFMYFEDVDLCNCIRKMGKKIILLPQVRILHAGGQSKLNTEKQKKQYYESQDYYFRKNFSLFTSYWIKLLRRFALFFGK